MPDPHLISSSQAKEAFQQAPCNKPAILLHGGARDGEEASIPPHWRNEYARPIGTLRVKCALSSAL